jgi:hypothetical protein
MTARHPSNTDGASWSIDDIPFGALAHEQVRDDQRLFYILASASFIEITSDLYARNLIEFFHRDGDVVEWLRQGWEKEELRHGVALKRYVQTAWPDFDWEAAYRSFLPDFAQFCTVEQLADTPALEMAARCVVETGTAAFYRMLSELSREPVLKQLAANICADEVRHYKHFYRHFLRYRAIERPGRTAVLRTIWNRTVEIEAEDALYAFRALYRARNPNTEFRQKDYEDYRNGVLQLSRCHFPRRMAIKMLLKPLDLNGAVGGLALATATSAAHFLLLRYAGRLPDASLNRITPTNERLTPLLRTSS